MRRCRCYEGQRAEAGGRQGPSHTGWSFIQTSGLVLILYINSAKQVVSHLEAKL